MIESNYYILTTRHGYVSVSLLHQWLMDKGLNIKLIKQLSGKEKKAKKKEYSITSKEGVIYSNTITLEPNDFLFRWGARSSINEGQAIVFNKVKNLNIASNKKLFRKLMQSHYIKVPFSVFNTNDLSYLDYKNGVIVRPDKHRAGQKYFDVNSPKMALDIINTKLEANEWYASEYFDKNKEFRVQYAFGKIISIKQKPSPGAGRRGPWNFSINEDEWEYINWGNYNLTMVHEVIKSAKVLGLDICAFDVMEDRYKRIVILEANTAPSLSPYTINRYAHLFKGIIDGNIDPFENKKIDVNNPKDYVWKNKHLKIEKNN